MEQGLIRESLEGVKTLPRNLQNTFQQENSNFLFEGRFYHIQFGLKGEIRADVSLRKYAIGTKLKRKSLFSKEKIEKPTKKLLWEFYDFYEERGIPISATSPVFQPNFDRESDEYYKISLMRTIRDCSGRISVGNELLEEIFGPLEEKIKEFAK